MKIPLDHRWSGRGAQLMSESRRIPHIILCVKQKTHTGENLRFVLDLEYDPITMFWVWVRVGSRRLPIEVESFGIGRHFYRNLSAACSSMWSHRNPRGQHSNRPGDVISAAGGLTDSVGKNGGIRLPLSTSYGNENTMTTELLSFQETKACGPRKELRQSYV
jgi:hypothetical protein